MLAPLALLAACAAERPAAAGPAPVSRDGLALTIRPDSSAPVVLVDDTTSEGFDYVRHEYAGRLAGTSFHVVALSHYEGSGWLLVHARTGRRVGVDARPVVSPDGARLATASMDLVAEFDPTRLAVLRLDGDSAVVEWSHEPGRWGPSDVRWVGADTLAFVAHHVGPGDPEPVRRSAGLVVRAGGRWRLALPADTGGVRRP
ncbi:hypothetical protein PYV61_22975 [Roseisolibacter sp. H3M3-2]|nr:hypothetical protein [Roseisolibacter sp. H3M3-2]